MLVLDVSAIDVLMIFPAWGEGEGAVYRIDNLKSIRSKFGR